MASGRWTRGWTYLTLALGTVVLGVLVNVFTDLLQRPDWRLGAIALAAVLVAALLLRLQSQHDREPARVWPRGRSPFPGLESFGSGDADVFFGRDEEVDTIARRLTGGSTGVRERFLLVTGPSGAGKSSLVNAGLLPLLKSRRPPWICLPPVTPVDRPLEVLRDAAWELVPATDHLPAAPGTLTEALRTLLSRHRRRRSVLIVLDQTEEFFTQLNPEDGRAVLSALREAAEEHARVRVVVVLRSDFFTTFEHSRWGAAVTSQPVTIRALDNVRDVVVRPAEKAGLRFEPPSLVDRIVEDAGKGAALPMVAYALQRLFERGGKDGVLRESDYEAFGGVSGAIREHADDVYADLRRGGAVRVLPTLLRLVAFDRVSGRATARPLQGKEMDEDERMVIERFVEARLVVASGEGDSSVYVVAHEALFDQWPPLRHEIAANKTALQTRYELERAAADWEASPRPENLLRGARLRAALEMLPTPMGRSLTSAVRGFLEQSRRADEETSRRLSEALAERARSVMGQDPELAILLAVASSDEFHSTVSARRALLAVLENPAVRVLRGHLRAVQAVSWAPSGSLVASASDDRTVQVWDSLRGEPEAVLAGHEDSVWDVAWSPDGTRLATASRDRTARIWSADTGETVQTLRGHGHWVGRVAWSPDGGRILTTSRDCTAVVWDVRTGNRLASLAGHGDAIWGAAWARSGQFVATASDDRTARVWDPRTGEQLQVLEGHRDAVWDAAFSVDERRLATASWDRSTRVWDCQSGEELQDLRGHSDAVRKVSWAPDGRRLTTASHDHTARVWDAETGAELLVLSGHEEAVRGVAWAPDGAGLVTGSHDRTLRVWAVEGGTIERRILRGHRAWVDAVAWSPDGRRLASASYDRTVRIWDSSTGAEVGRLSGHGEVVKDVSWSPDGTRLVSGSHDGTAVIWEMATGNEIRVLAGHRDAVRGVAWSPAGDAVATCSLDGEARIWDATDGRERLVLRGHRDGVEGVAWSPAGDALATASYDGTLRLWSASAPDAPAVIQSPAGGLNRVAWSPDGRFVAAACDGNVVLVWDRDSPVDPTTLESHDDDVGSGLVAGRATPRERLPRPDGTHLGGALGTAGHGPRPARGRGHRGGLGSRGCRRHVLPRSDRPPVGCHHGRRDPSAQGARPEHCC